MPSGLRSFATLSWQYVHSWSNRRQAARSRQGSPAADPKSDMGPMINLDAVRRVDKILQDAIEGGRRVLVRGGPFKDGPLAKGAFYRPTLLEITNHDFPIAQNEVFGPVLVMRAFGSEAEAIALANNSVYGLSASVWSENVDRPMGSTASSRPAACGSTTGR
jgi:betaine-aldehyde dehydrogenase